MTGCLQVFCGLHNLSKNVIALPALFIAFTLSAQSQLLMDINQHEDIASDEYSRLTVGGNKVYFLVNNTELWKTTGNSGGTVRIKPFNRIHSLTCIGSVVYFVADDGSGQALWKTTGTFASTVKVREFPEETVSELTVIGEVLYFSAHATGLGQELWRTDGTADGTAMIRDIRPGKFGSDPASLVNVDGVLYFTANDGKTGHELWKSDGTASGTVLVKDVRIGNGTWRVADLNMNDDHLNGSAEYDIRSLAVWDEHVYISAYDNSNSWSLYKSDGTGGNATKIRSLNAIAQMIPTPSRLHLFAQIQNSIYSETTHWVTDGTSEGTESISDEVYANTIDYGLVGDVLYFSTYGEELWRSDGTACGTFPVDIGATYPNEITVLGDRLIFSAFEVDYGTEPYAFNLADAPANPCEEPAFTEARLATGDEDADAVNVDFYPNPFQKEISLIVRGDESDVIAVHVFTYSGFPVEKFSGLSANTDHRFGTSWKPGHYILRINVSGKVTFQQVLKE